MEKVVYGLRPEDIKGLNWWFWYREACAGVTEMYATIYDSTFLNFGDRVLVVVLFIFAPLVYLCVPPYVACFAKRNILKRMHDDTDDGHVLVHSKMAYEYFTVLSKLRGN